MQAFKATKMFSTSFFLTFGYNNDKILRYRKIHGGVKVSTGILKYAKRAGVQAALKDCNLNINANNNRLAYAA